MIGKDVRAERLDRLLAGAGHSLRTPPNSVLGFTEVLLVELPGSLNEEQRRLLHNVRSGALQMDMTIDDLLDLVRIETGMMKLPLESVDIGAVVDDVRSELQRSADEKGLSLEVEIPPGMTCFTNERAISRILVNLVGNAISFTGAGGVQILGVVSDGVGAAGSTSSIRGSASRSPEHARLFEPFERGPAPEGDTRAGAGSGSRSAADSRTSSERRSWCRAGRDEGAGSA